MSNPILAQKRKKKALTRKNFFLTLSLTIIFWLLATFIFFLVDPDWPGTVYLFFLVLFFALLFTISTIFANTRRGFLLTTVIIVFLIFRYFGIGNLLNLILLVGIAMAIEIYYTGSIK